MHTPTLRHMGVAFLFAVCGAASAELLNPRWAEKLPFQSGGASSNVMIISVAVPFALVATGLVWRNWRGILVIPLVIGTWVAAFWAALAFGVDNRAYLSMCVGGLTGGIGLCFCDFLARWRFQVRRLLGISFTGVLAALVFVPSFDWFSTGHPDQAPPLGVVAAFAVWQCAVGSYLYALSDGVK